MMTDPKYLAIVFHRDAGVLDSPAVRRYLASIYRANEMEAAQSFEQGTRSLTDGDRADRFEHKGDFREALSTERNNQPQPSEA